MHAKKRIWENSCYARLAKHKCPNCGAILSIVKERKTVNSNSDDAKCFDFQNYDTSFIGDVEFIWDEFKCNNCNFRSSIKEMKSLERQSFKRN